MNWLNNGQSVKVPVGNYRIFFKELEGFQTPSPIVVGVIKNETTNVNVEYLPIVNGPLGERGVFGGGYTGSNTPLIDYVTIATTGNAINFGNLTVARYALAACSNGERGVFGGGYASSDTSLIDYVTIATTGNAVNFGNLTLARYYLAACSNGERGVFGGGCTGTSLIDYVTIATTGNAVNFGNLTVARQGLAACSGN